ncbi:Pentatricopeptide repeat-containing protein At2g41080 [Linum perenne]
MRAEGVEINQFTFPSVLTACAAVLAGNFGVQVHGCIVKSGFGANIFVQSALVDMYAKCRDLDSAMKTIESMEIEDRSHPMMKEIYLKVDEVIAVIKEAGYVPDMDYALHDMEKEGKELGLAYHSEKLAVAFALLVMPIGAPIRIYKNLRVCGDCHAAFKYVSRLYGRCISLRDSNCFHHFVDGKCSCGDYW